MKWEVTKGPGSWVLGLRPVTERASCFQAPMRARPAGEPDKMMFGRREGSSVHPPSLCFPPAFSQLPCPCGLGYWAGTIPGSLMTEF